MTGMADPRPFEPDWTLSPGRILRAELEARGITPAQFAGHTGLGQDTIAAILGASVAIDADMASRIGSALGTSAQMWLNAERIYRAALARGAKDCSGEIVGQ